jgi:hypothetical protein
VYSYVQEVLHILTVRELSPCSCYIERMPLVGKKLIRWLKHSASYLYYAIIFVTYILQIPPTT